MVECSTRTCGTPRFHYIYRFSPGKKQASVAQLAEQLICNQQVVGSNPSAGSVIPLSWQSGALFRIEQEGQGRIENTFNPALIRQNKIQTGGGFPERSKGSDCKSDGIAFAGSNPAPPTCGFPGRRPKAAAVR